jgi:RNA polymerase sigma factor (sigma-70 family)
MDDGKGRITEFFGREWARLAGYVRRRLADSAEEDASDLVQDVFASIFDRDEMASEIENVSAYVYRSLRNRISDSLRSRRHDLSLDAPSGEDEGLCLADLVPSHDESSLDALQRLQMEEAFRKAFLALPERDRDLIVANEFEGRTFRELAEESGEPIGTLLSRKSRAVARLAAAMVEHNPND